MNNITDKLNMVTDYIKNKNNRKKLVIAFLCVCVVLVAINKTSSDSKEIKSEKFSYTNKAPSLHTYPGEEFRSILNTDLKKGDQPISQFYDGIIHLDMNPLCKGSIDYDSVNDAWICSYHDDQSKKIVSMWFPNGKSRDTVAAERMFNGGKYPSNVILGFAAVTHKGPLDAKKEKISSSASWIAEKMARGIFSIEEITTRKFKNEVTLYRYHLNSPFTDQELWNHLVDAWNAKVNKK